MDIIIIVITIYFVWISIFLIALNYIRKQLKSLQKENKKRTSGYLYQIENIKNHLDQINEKLNDLQIKNKNQKKKDEKVSKLNSLAFVNIQALNSSSFKSDNKNPTIKIIPSNQQTKPNEVDSQEKENIEEEIKEDKEIKEMIEEDEKKKIEEWTELECGEILFDSEKDNWNKNTSVFNQKIYGQKQLVFLIEDEEKEINGYYLNNSIPNEYKMKNESDKESFCFTLRKKGMEREMNKNRMKSERDEYVMYSEKDTILIEIGGMTIKKYENRGRCHVRIDEKIPVK